MIDIITEKGKVYSYDEETGKIIKDGVVLPSSSVEPVYSHTMDLNAPPRFSGILLKDTNQILTLSGKIHSLTDPNTII